jgi:HEAT repeat protein
VLALGNLTHPRVVDVLVELLGDEEVAGHAVIALGKLRAPSARAALEPFLDHHKAWVRQEARKALAALGRKG